MLFALGEYTYFPTRAGELRNSEAGGSQPSLEVLRKMAVALSIIADVLLLDDHELVRDGIRLLLESDDDIEVVGEAAFEAAVFGVDGVFEPEREDVGEKLCFDLLA